MCLSSPPFFDYEQYESRGTQSYEKYDNYHFWIDDWLYLYLLTCYKVTKKGGVICIYIEWCGGNDMIKDMLEMVERKLPQIKFYDYIYFESSYSKRLYRITTFKVL